MTITATELEAIKHVKTRINGALSDLRACDLQIDEIIKANDSAYMPARLPFSWPVGDITRRTLAPWWIAQGYAERYPPIMGRDDWHTGVDLNEAHDVDAPVYAVADGVIVFAGAIKGWQGEIVIIEHTLEDKRLIWSRYAHIDMLIIDQWTVYPGQQVKRGELIGHIADYTPYGPKQDHLHFDLSWHDLGKAPGDWPNTDIARLRVDYVDPIAWILERLP